MNDPKGLLETLSSPLVFFGLVVVATQAGLTVLGTNSTPLVAQIAMYCMSILLFTSMVIVAILVWSKVESLMATESSVTTKATITEERGVDVDEDYDSDYDAKLRLSKYIYDETEANDRKISLFYKHIALDQIQQEKNQALKRYVMFAGESGPKVKFDGFGETESSLLVVDVKIRSSLKELKDDLFSGFEKRRKKFDEEIVRANGDSRKIEAIAVFVTQSNEPDLGEAQEIRQQLIHGDLVLKIYSSQELESRYGINVNTESGKTNKITPPGQGELS